MDCKINVTPLNIAQGKGLCGEWCPVALSLREYYGKDITTVSLHGIEVCEGNVWIWLSFGMPGTNKRHKTAYEAIMPDKGAKFVCEYDNGERVEPIELELKFEEIPAGPRFRNPPPKLEINDDTNSHIVLTP